MKSLITSRSTYTWVKLNKKQIKACSDADLRFLSSLRELVSRAVGDSPLNPHLPSDSPIRKYYPEGWDHLDGINALFCDGIVFATQKNDWTVVDCYTEKIENGIGYGYLVTRWDYYTWYEQYRSMGLRSFIRSPFDMALLDELVCAMSDTLDREALTSVLGNSDVLGVDYGSYASALNWYSTERSGDTPAILNYVIRRFADKGIFVVPAFTLIAWMSKVTFKNCSCIYDLARLIGGYYNEHSEI